jgi:hypothetical protein
MLSIEVRSDPLEWRHPMIRHKTLAPAGALRSARLSVPASGPTDPSRPSDQSCQGCSKVDLGLPKQTSEPLVSGRSGRTNSFTAV